MQKEEERRTSEEDDITEAGVRTKENIWKPCVLSTIGKETYHFVGHEISIWESLDSFGSVIWPAAITLCQYLESNQALVNLFDKAVLEIGSGTGLVSIVASLLGAWVTSTDLPEVLGNLRSNLSRNTRGRCRYTPQVAELSWGHELEKTFPHSVYKYDYILAADVVYHHDFLQELLVTMCHFCQPGSTLIWANKVRFNSDLLFLERFQNTFNTCLLADNGEVKILSATMKDDSKPELLRPIIRLEKAEGQTDQDDWQSSRKTRREMNAEEEFQQQAMVVAAEDNIMDDAGEILEEQEKNIDGEKSSGSTETDLPQRSIDNEEEEEEEEEEEGREEVVKGEDEDYKEEEEEDEEEEESRLKNKKESLWEPVIYFKPGKEIYHFLGQEITIQESIDSYGATVWPAALTLCQYLESPLGRQKIQLLDRSVLELGAGTGLLSVVATLLGAKVTATDLPEILNNLTYNLNKNTRGLWRHQPQVKDLHWGHKLQENFSNSTQHYDFVLASDVVYHHSFLSELLVTMHHFCQQGSCLIWANKVRYASDLTFIKRFLQTFDTTLLEEIDEVRIYSATSKP